MIKYTIRFFLLLAFYTYSITTSNFSCSTLNFFILDKVFDNYVILSNKLEVINELNFKVLAL